MINAPRPFYAIVLSALLLACGEPNQRLDEYVFYDGPQFRLKVVRYYRNIPFNYLGEYAVVMCQSENTRHHATHEALDAGWRMLGEANTQGNRDAREVALSSMVDYQVFDDHTLIGKKHAFNISFDACGHFISWDPTRLPQSMIDAVPKPDSCAPQGPLDCRYYDFESDRKPHYEQISVAGEGQVNFTVRTPTFKGVEALRVRTRNNGALWHVDTVGLGADRQRLQPDSIRSLPVRSLEEEMEGVSLVEWLESTLPPRSIVIWPDALTECGKPPGKAQDHSALCAEIRFTDSEGGSGKLSITMAADAENRASQASFHSALYTFAGQTSSTGSLSGLRERLVASR